MVKGQRTYRFTGKKLRTGGGFQNWPKHKSKVSGHWCSSAKHDQSYTHETNGVSTTNDNYIETDWNSDK